MEGPPDADATIDVNGQALRLTTIWEQRPIPKPTDVLEAIRREFPPTPFEWPQAGPAWGSGSMIPSPAYRAWMERNNQAQMKSEVGIAVASLSPREALQFLKNHQRMASHRLTILLEESLERWDPMA